MGHRDVDASVSELPPDSPHRMLGYGWQATAVGTYADREWLGCFSETRYFETADEAEQWRREVVADDER